METTASVCKNPRRGDPTCIGSLDFQRTSQWASVPEPCLGEGKDSRVPKINLEDKKALKLLVELRTKMTREEQQGS